MLQICLHSARVCSVKQAFVSDAFNQEYSFNVFCGLLLSESVFPDVSVDLATYVSRFQWDRAKYPTAQPLKTLTDIISKVYTRLYQACFKQQQLFVSIFMSYCINVCLCVVMCVLASFSGGHWVEITQGCLQSRESQHSNLWAEKWVRFHIYKLGIL